MKAMHEGEVCNRFFFMIRGCAVPIRTDLKRQVKNTISLKRVCVLYFRNGIMFFRTFRLQSDAIMSVDCV